MSLDLLLDENISHVIAAQVGRHRPLIPIQSIYDWQSGNFVGSSDEELIEAAHANGLTLVTYDLKTIPEILASRIAAGRSHSEVVFVDDATMPSNDFGMLVRSLILLWERYGQEEWLDRISFLDRASS